MDLKAEVALGVKKPGQQLQATVQNKPGMS